MATKKSFALRIDAKTLKAMQRWARDDLRSLNSQIEFVLRGALRHSGRLPNSGQENDASNGDSIE
ncbi:MAG: Arc family DNA binding domain-containing protein [Gammaproteobacteria bacterium]|nr:Arc family DNA binding domain-containing protein [Gammaproteobacteria bacterium]MBT8111061.1 Arc family DNA binding domain-containing protein [Gammaproteobacteria bacterium]NND47978.1 Arc family DNA binding domain-containing protein [Woeseiaceae bacterium]NNL45759.1 Arc family DNA binding domain-containing protein [Woeseiaceae bacterium]